MLNYLRALLWPLGILYSIITSTRNFLFDLKVLKSTTPSIFSIGVGNLSVGGTGKTPMILYLSSRFSNVEIATLSRGYGRKTKGFLEVTPSSTAEEVGDEPLLFRKNHVRSFVSEKRVLGWEKISQCKKDFKLLLLDDVFQHRWIRPHRLLLLTTFNQPFFLDSILPVGWLRESRSGARRADAVVVTKCPSNISWEQKKDFLIKTALYTSAPVFFAFQEYGEPYDLWTNQPVEIPSSATVVAGIAKPDDFFSFVRARVKNVQAIHFSDHHTYLKSELQACFDLGHPVLMTEKDAVKWRQFNEFKNKNAIVWPIEVKIENQNDFDSLLLRWFGESQSSS